MVALEVLSRAALRSLWVVVLGTPPRLAAADRGWFDTPLSGTTMPSADFTPTARVAGSAVGLVSSSAVSAALLRWTQRDMPALAGALASGVGAAGGVADALALRRLPPELDALRIWLAVEPGALGEGRVGPWALTLEAALAGGLRVDTWVDERLDLERATAAALDTLAALNARFGDWPLALAAYCADATAVEAGQRMTGARDAWSLAAAGALPAVAADGLPRLMALMHMLRDPNRWALDTVVVTPQAPTARVEMPAGALLAALERQATLDPGALTRRNPALLRGRTPPAPKTWRVWVSAADAERVSRALAGEPTGGRALESHTVRFGEWLPDIARQYATTEADLRALNELRPDAEPRVDTVLLVPLTASAPPSEPAPRFDPPTYRIDPRGRREVYLRLRPDTPFTDVAAFFGVSLGELSLWNALDVDAPRSRVVALRVFAPPEVDLRRVALIDAAAADALSSPAPPAAHVASPVVADTRPSQVHRVVAGDTLTRLARRYQTTPEAIRALNGLRGDELKLGQVVRVQ